MTWLARRWGWILLVALIADFPQGFCAWFSLVPLPRQLAGAVFCGAILDGALSYGWETFLRKQVRGLMALFMCSVPQLSC